MALINKLEAIANAIRKLKGTSNKLTLEEMANEVDTIPTRTEQDVLFRINDVSVLSNSAFVDADLSIPSGYYNDLIVKGEIKYLNVKKGGTITPLKASQTAISKGYTALDDITVAAIPSSYIIPSGSETKTANGTYDVTSLAELVVDVPAPTPSYDTPSINVSSGGLITASANGKSNTQQLTTQAAKTVTPTTSSQTAVASGRYTTGTVTVGAIPSQYIIPSGSETKTENGTYDVTKLAQLVVNVSGGGLPSGFTAIATGSHTLNSNVAGGSTFTVTHNLGVVPDMFLFFATSNVATTYSMLFAGRSSMFGYRSTSYLNKCFYHGNSTTTVTGADVTTSYGIKTLSSTQATVTTYSSSGSYYWRAGTYKWIAIKF